MAKGGSTGAPAGAGTKVGAGKTVVVLGGGVAGLSAAHFLSQQEYTVHVVERRMDADLGGKAYSYQFGEGPDEQAIDRLPGEHGFRFFPGFYQHVIDTMEEIPCTCRRRKHPHPVSDHLVELKTAALIRAEGKGRDGSAPTLRLPVPTEKHSPGVPEIMRAVMPMRRDLLGPIESYQAAAVLTRLVTACHSRWTGEYENRSWWDVSEAWRHSERYGAWFAKGLTRSFVATQAEAMSARTGGKIMLQLLFDVFMSRGRSSADRVLDGPTSEVWIEPWIAHLEAHDVTFHCGHEVTGIEIDTTGEGADAVKTIRSITTHPVAPLPEHVDHFVSALSCRALQNLLSLGLAPLLEADPALAGIFNLETRWMNGAFFFATEDDLGTVTAPGLPGGHTILLDSEWALTMLDQQHIWSESPGGLGGLGNGIKAAIDRNKVAAIMSVDVSDWESPGHLVPPAERPQPGDVDTIPRACGLQDEIWRQIGTHLPGLSTTTPPLSAIDPSVTLDLDQLAKAIHPAMRVPAVVGNGGGAPIHDTCIERENADELLVNTVGSWQFRPSPETGVANLFLVGDYVATSTDFASMEGANESARRATNIILEHDGGQPVVKLWPLRLPTRWWFVIPRRAAMAFDAAVTHPLKLRAPYRVPLVLMVAGATVDGLAGRVLAKLGHPVPGAQRIVSRTDGSATRWDVDPGP